MAKTKYDFFNDVFTTYEDVAPPKIQLKMPLFNDPLDISDWAENIVTYEKPDGTVEEVPIVKNLLTVDNTPEVPIVQPIIQKVSEEKPKNLSNQKKTWVEELTAAYRKIGLNDNAIKNLIAKNALESNWGKSTGGKYNYGNISEGYGWKGKTVLGNDKDANGKPIKQIWREYDSVDDYVKDEINLLKRLYYFNENDPIEVFSYKLKHGVGGRQYATDRNYESSLNNIYKQIQL